MPADAGMLRVLETGPRTVIGIVTVESGKAEALAECRKQLDELVRETKCEVLEVDLSGVVTLPSPLLAQLAVFRRRGVRVELRHPSQDIRYVLQISRLDREFKILDDVASEESSSSDDSHPNGQETKNH